MRTPRAPALPALLCLLLLVLPLASCQQQGAPASADIVFLVDGSVDAHLPAMRDFLVTLLERLAVGPGGVHVGVVQFGEEPRTLLALGMPASREQVLEAVRGLSFSGGERADLGQALDTVAQSLLAGPGRDVPRVLVLVAVRPADDDIRDGVAALKRAGVFCFALGMPAAEAELREVATAEQLVFLAPDSDGLRELQARLLPLLLGVVQRTVVLQPPTVVTQVIEVNKRDILFLLDGSPALGAAGFQAVREFLLKLVQKLEVGPDLVRVAVAQFADAVRPEFHFDTHPGRRELTAALRRMRPLDGPSRRLGPALDAVRTSLFTEAAGHRAAEGVPKILVLFVGGPVPEDVRLQAQELRRSGVLALAVGDPAAADRLREVAFDPSLVFMPTEFRAAPLQAMLTSLLAPLRTLTGTREVPASPRDLVFLLDATVGAAHFPLLLRLVSGLVDGLPLDRELVRVGLAQFGDSPVTEFPLGALHSKAEVLGRLRELRPRVGGARNTGAALSHALGRLFTPEGGSRVREGVPQLLLLLTAGPAQDAFLEAADGLARAGVLTFCVGTRPADRAELERVAFNPSLVYLSDGLQGLPELAPRLLTPLSTYISAGLDEGPLGMPGSQRDVVFLLDGSSNLQGQFPAVRDFLYKVVEELDVRPEGTRVAVAQFSNDVRVESRLDEHMAKAELLAQIKRLKLKGGRVLNLGVALEQAQSRLLAGAVGGRAEQGVRQFLVLLVAGRSSDSVDEPARHIRQSSLVPFVIQARGADPAELGKIVPAPAFILAAESLPKIGDLQAQILHLFKSVDEEAESGEKDVVFLLDGSDNVLPGFSLLTEFVQRVVDGLDVGPDRVRVALVQYSDRTRPEFYLNSYMDREAVLGALRRLRPLGGPAPNTGAALDFVLRNVLVGSAGSRADQGVPQMLVVLTADRSRDDVRAPAAVLKREGAVPLGIGIGDADIAEMQAISFVPDFAITVPDFGQLRTVQQVVSERVVRLSREELSRLLPTLPPAPGSGGQKDVVFLLEGSQRASAHFPRMLGLVERLVSSLDIGFDATRVAVIQFSEDPRVEFLLNAHGSRNDVLTAVRRLRPQGGRGANLGTALEYVTRSIFQRPLGSRIEEGVPQFLVVLSAGPSQDELDIPSAELHRAGVAPLTVSLPAQRQELARVALSPEHVFTVSTFQELLRLEPRLLAPLTTLSAEQIRHILDSSQYPSVLEGEAADVVFLIDSSDAMRPEGLAHVRDFLSKLVRKLSVAPGRVRVGAVQFSQEAHPEFYLKTHRSQAAVLEALRRLRFRGGGPPQLGRALDFVARNLFVKSAGSRIEDGVPQRLLLFLGGSSRDDVSRAAQVLRSSGVVSLGLGDRQGDAAQLLTVAGDPGLVVTVRDFSRLPDVEDKVMSILASSGVTPAPPGVETPAPSQPERKKADIVFLLDGSMNFGREGFQQVLRFVAEVVDTLYEPGDSIQVGLVQYNSDPTDEFFLRDFSSKEQILDAIRKVVYKGGRHANARVGLEHLLRRHFVAEAGSRREQRVPQMAFLIAGGKSTQDAQEASLALTRSGVKVFAVGVRGVDSAELAGLASNSATAFRVGSVQELTELSEQVLETLHDGMREALCPGVGDTDKVCNVDVVLGFDGSSGQNVFVSQKGLEHKVELVLGRVAHLSRLSCSGLQTPGVRVSVLASTPSGPVEAFDFSEFQPELLDKFRNMRSQHPYVLTAAALRAYQGKFRESAPDSVKVVIHFTDGADGDLTELQKASEELREGGVHALMLVGLERVSDLENLMRLEFGRGFMYNRPLRLNLLDLDYELAEQLDNVAERVCCGVPCKCSGERGDRGPIGNIGPKGLSGEEGYPGYPGDEGGPGERGPPGVNGTQGFQGCSGQRGVKGSRGFPGEKGEVGEFGLDGLDGEEGDKGLPGSAGEKGSPGRRGNKGPRGIQGERGDMGIRGDPGESGRDSQQRGPKGEVGDLGPMGLPGRDGTSGRPGEPGKAGGFGRRGPAGAKGNPGGPGQQGSAGEQGPRGSQGPPGPIGPPGQMGEQGIPGPRGSGGVTGAPGDRGRTGPLGRKGDAGDPGPKGSIGSRGPRGQTGDDGRDGVGSEGRRGRKGERGFPGYPGPKGNPGEPGTAGGPGPKGVRGRRGNSGPPGAEGQKGDSGFPGSAGPRGDRGDSMDQCALIKTIKENCPCCYGPLECPVYPTELAFALDTSEGVTQDTFGRMREVVLALVRDLVVAESNCPRGARVAVVTYNDEVTTEIRFADSGKKAALLDRIRNIPGSLSSRRPSLESAMSFVARNTFKRVRGGFLTRKVAVFFSNRPVQASQRLREAVIQLWDAGVTPLFLTSQEDRQLASALQVNNTAVGHTLVLPARRDLSDFLKNVLTCHVCLDVCNVDPSCNLGSWRPTFRDRRAAGSALDLDVAFLLDGSESTSPAQFHAMKKFAARVVAQLALSPEPAVSPHLARVALLQPEAEGSPTPVRVDAGLADFGSRERLLAFLDALSQGHGQWALGPAVDFTVERVMEAAPSPRARRLLVLLLAGRLDGPELTRAREAVLRARCQGFFSVVVGVGRGLDAREAAWLASEPRDVFFKQVDSEAELGQEPMLRFARMLPAFLSGDSAFHLSPEVRKHCDWFQGDQPARSPVKFGHRPVNMDTNVSSSTTSKPLGPMRLVTSTERVTSTTTMAVTLNLPASKSAGHRLAITKPETMKPETRKPEAMKPEITKTETTKTEAIKLEITKLETRKPEAMKPETTKLEITKLETKKPEATKLETIKVEARKPEATKSEATKAEAMKPETRKPEATKSETTKVEATRPEVSKAATSRHPAAPKPAAASRPEAERLQAPVPKPEAAKPEAPRSPATRPLAHKPGAKPAVRTPREVHVSQVTENSAKLQWDSPDPAGPYVYALSVSSAQDQSLVLRQNLTATERTVGGLKPGHAYQVTVLCSLRGQLRALYQATFSTRRVQLPPSPPVRPAGSTIQLVVNPELADRTETCLLAVEVGTCKTFVVRWFYDPTAKSCMRFWYGGCGGNANRFSTQDECERLCHPEAVAALQEELSLHPPTRSPPS